MNFHRPPLTTLIKTLNDQTFESEQILIGNESITSKKDVIRQLQDQVMFFRDTHNFTHSEHELLKQFELLLERKRRPIVEHNQSQSTDLTRRKKSEQFRMKRAKRRVKIKQYAKKLSAARRRFRILGQFISNKEGKVIEETFGSHVFSDSHNFNLKIGRMLKNKFGDQGNQETQKAAGLDNESNIGQEINILHYQMNELLNYALGKCFQENILNVASIRRKKSLLTSDSMVIEHARKNSSFISKKNTSGDLLSDFEYANSKIRQRSIHDVQLPLLNLESKKYFFENHLTNESDCHTTKRNRNERLKSLASKCKTNKKNYLQIDISSQHLSIIYKNLLGKLKNNFTRFQLSLYLNKYLGQLDYICRLLSLLNFPSIGIITYQTFKHLMENIMEMQQIEILQCVFQAYDMETKGFISTSDLFKMFQSNGAIQQDVDFIYKNFPISEEKEKKLKKIYLCDSKQKPRPMLITTMKNQLRNHYKVRRCIDNVIKFEMFCKIFNDSIPEFFKEFIRLMFYDFI